jgi:hypothetical protein
MRSDLPKVVVADAYDNALLDGRFQIPGMGARPNAMTSGRACLQRSGDETMLAAVGQVGDADAGPVRQLATPPERVLSVVTCTLVRGPADAC